MEKNTPSRRKYRRRLVQVEISIVLKNPFSKPVDGKKDGLTLIGRTRNLSENGVAFVVSASNIDRYLKRKDLAFSIALELPGGKLELQAKPIHYQRILSPEGAVSYLVGSCFVRTAPPQLSALETYLNTLPSA